MSTIILPENYINDKNEKIWNAVQEHYLVILEHDPYEWSWKVIGPEFGIVKIVAPTTAIEIGSFTHELLHVYIEILGMSNSQEVLESMYGEKSFEVLTFKGLFAQIHNYCCHRKMYPFFEEMGFSEDEFISPKHRARLDWFELLWIRLGFMLKWRRKHAVTRFIGQTTSLFNNVGQSYEQYNMKYLSKLERIRPDLFRIIHEFDNSWENCDDLNFARIFKNFDNELDEWLKK